MDSSTTSLLPDVDYVQLLIQTPPSTIPSKIALTVTKLGLLPHGEGGYYSETDRDTRTVPNPFQNDAPLPNATAIDNRPDRNASTTIYYLLAPSSPVGHFHRNKGRTVHTLHRGRGRYVLIHADQIDENGHAPVETFIVGHDIENGERLQWIVEGGKFKASYLLPDPNEDQSSGGLLISETVVPGFEFSDHDFMTAESLSQLVTPAQGNELKWLLNRGEQAKWKAS